MHGLRGSNVKINFQLKQKITKRFCLFYTFLRSLVCLSVRRLSYVVYHILSPCLKRSTELGAIWQEYAIRMLDGIPDPEGMGDLGAKPTAKNAILNCSQIVRHQLPPGEYKRIVEWTGHSDSTFREITSVLVLVSTICWSMKLVFAAGLGDGSQAVGGASSRTFQTKSIRHRSSQSVFFFFFYFILSQDFTVHVSQLAVRGRSAWWAVPCRSRVVCGGWSLRLQPRLFRHDVVAVICAGRGKKFRTTKCRPTSFSPPVGMYIQGVHCTPHVYIPIKILTPQRKGYQGVLWFKPNMFGKIYVNPAYRFSLIHIKL